MHVSQDVAKELKQAGTTAPLKSDGVRCEKTKRLGSNRITTVCHTKEELEAIREETQRQLQHRERQG